MRSWFTSDIHFRHRNIIRLCGRPFDDVYEMDEEIIANFNSVVRPEDDLYIVGDVDFKGHADNLVARLNGRKILIEGNHDKGYDATLFDEIHQICEVIIPVDGRNYRFVMCHYPFAEWPDFYKQAIHLHGHQHNKADYNEKMRSQKLYRYDVGVDANDFFPVSAEQIVSFFGLDA